MAHLKNKSPQFLRLRSFEQIETDANGAPLFSFKKISFDNYNLLIGPNASGKTRLFNVFKFFRDFHGRRRQPKPISTKLHANFHFERLSDSASIEYELNVNAAKIEKEEIRNASTGQRIFSSATETLFNEQKKVDEKLLFNKSQSITRQIEGKENLYSTIQQVGQFFSRLAFLDGASIDTSNMSAVIQGEGGIKPSIPDSKLTNIGQVILYWKKEDKAKYSFFKKLLIDIFPYIRGFGAKKISASPPIEILEMNEQGLSKPVIQADISSGLVRAMGLIALTLGEVDLKKSRPSTILVDEIDNGLDYRVITRLVDWVVNVADEIPVIFSSHSPLVCNCVPPEHWRVVSRQKSVISMMRPTDVQETRRILESKELLNWEVYKGHISKSDKYRAH